MSEMSVIMVSEILVGSLHKLLQVVLIDPGVYREVSQIVEKDSRGKGHLEIVSLKDVKDDEEKFE